MSPALEPEFSSANKSMTAAGFTDLEMMAMDGTAADAHEVMEHVAAKGFPTLVMFRNADPSDFIVYEGERSSKDMVAFLEEEIKAYLRRKHAKAKAKAKAKVKAKATAKAKAKATAKAKAKGDTQIKDKNKGSGRMKSNAKAKIDVNAKEPQAATTISREAVVSESGQQVSVGVLLEQLGLQRLGDLFEQEEIDIHALKLLRESDLKELGIKTGPRIKLMNAIDGLLTNPSEGEPKEEEEEEEEEEEDGTGKSEL